MLQLIFLVTRTEVSYTMELQEIPFDDSSILSAMQNVTNWFLLGTYLKLEQPVLKKISADYGREGTERCKLEMIACWKRQDPAANWQKLKQALRSRNYDLAKSQTDGDDTYYTFEPLPYQQDQLGKSPKQRQRIDSISNNALQPRCCGKHKDLLQYFCNEPSCSQLLCCQCLATGNHSDHDWKELGQAFVSMATRLEQAGHATKETANTTQRQMRALRTEENRLRSKCETAKASICTNIGDIRSQFDNRKAYFEHNLEHAAQRHSFLKHRKPRETLSMEYEALQELQKHGEDVLVGLATEDAMSLGDVEKATDRLKEIQDTVRKFQTQCSLHTSQFEANPSKVRAKLSNYGEVKVDTFEQESHSSSIEPYESVFKSKQRPRSRSATEVSSLAAAAQQSFSSRQYSRMKHPPVPAKPSRHQSMGGPIGATKNNGVFVRVLPSHPSSPTHFKRSGNMTFSHRPKSAEIACRSVASQHQEDTEDIYDDPYSPPIFFLIPPPPSFAPPPSPPPCQDGTQYLEVINSK